MPTNPICNRYAESFDSYGCAHCGHTPAEHFRPGRGDAITFQDMLHTLHARLMRWHPDYPIDEAWTLADWSNALAGEVGEACNVVKKIRRVETGRSGRNDPSVERLRADLAEELADSFCYLAHLADKANIDLERAVVEKFNSVSIREGFPERLRHSRHLPRV